MAAALHPGLERWDVLTVTDAVIGSHNARVNHLQHVRDGGREIVDSVIGPEGV